MSYAKQTWQTGDTITAEKLNHMEDGIAAAGGEYDFVLDTRDSDMPPTAAGKSVSDLFDMVNDGELPNVLALQSGGVDKIVSFLTNDVNNIQTFMFFWGEEFSAINSDGTATIASDPYTFTYDSATKEYTFAFA